MRDAKKQYDLIMSKIADMKLNRELYVPPTYEKALEDLEHEINLLWKLFNSYKI